MEGIHDINEEFDFIKLNIGNPISKPGGFHLLKFSVNNESLYVQPHKCFTKNGIIKGKKTYTDLLFTNENEKFMTWLEDLETYSQNYIYENRERFFDGSLELDDIESFFISPLKFIKSGKNYLVRVNIPTVMGKPALKIYDESENEVNIESIDNNTEITSILEFKGIKCSARSFQIDIEVKQMMKMEPVQLFTKCIIRPSNKSTNKIEVKSEEPDNEVELEEPDNEVEPEVPENEIVLETEEKNELSVEPKSAIEKNVELQEDLTIVEKKNENISLEDNKEENEEKDLGIIDELVVDTNSLEEIKLDPISILESNEVVEIKEANEVYYKMYREAIKRARLARDLALSSFMEAKNIKNKYMLDESLIDSDDESDLEKELEDV